MSLERNGTEWSGARGFKRPERYDPEARPKSLTQMGFDFRKTYVPERSAAKEHKDRGKLVQLPTLPLQTERSEG